jgi:hypothetical protein
MSQKETERDHAEFVRMKATTQPRDLSAMTQTDLLIGPLIERAGRFCYDIFTPEEGLKSSFSYRRIEEARYDRRAFLAEARRDPRHKARICETLKEFLRLVEAASRRRDGEAGHNQQC